MWQGSLAWEGGVGGHVSSRVPGPPCPNLGVGRPTEAGWFLSTTEPEARLLGRSLSPQALPTIVSKVGLAPFRESLAARSLCSVLRSWTRGSVVVGAGGCRGPSPQVQSARGPPALHAFRSPVGDPEGAGPKAAGVGTA